MPDARRTSRNEPGSDRARQFMPFAALKGYYDLVREKERAVEPRRELTEDEVFALSQTLAQVKRGCLVRVRYYDTDAYVSACGVVSRIDTTFHVLTVVKTQIPFEDLAELAIVSPPE